MPLFPDELYYFPEESTVKYSLVPQGDLAIERLIEGKPDIWCNPSMPRVKKQKTIILGNLELGCLDIFENLELYDEKINELIHAGFQIYAWHEDRLKPVEKEGFSCLDLLFDPLKEITHPDIMVDAAVSQYRLSRDQLFILDGPALYGLTSPEGTLAKRAIRNEPEIFKEPGLSILKQTMPPVTTIYHEVFSEKSNGDFLKLLSDFPAATRTERYFEVKFASNDIAARFTKALCGGESYTLQGVTFTPEQLATLAKLPLNCTYIRDSNLIIKLLEKCPELNDLSLTHLSMTLADVLASIPATFPTVRHLHIKHSKISAHCLPAFLAKFPNLESISISNSELTGNVTVPFNTFPKLSSILFYDVKATHITVEKLIESTPDLTYLTMHNSTINGNIDIETLPKLRTLEINSDQVKVLRNLGHIAPTLNHLTINGDYNASLQPMVNSLRERDVLVFWYDERRAFSMSSDILPFGIPSTNSTTSAPRPKKNEPRSPNTKNKLDANTSFDPSEKLHATRIFYSAPGFKTPAVNDYRLDVYQSIKINDKPCTVNNCFTVEKEGDLRLIACDVVKSVTDVYPQVKRLRKNNIYYGKQTLTLTNEWQALASLSPNDKLRTYHVSPDVDIEIQYSERDDLYYVRLKADTAAQDVAIDFVLEVPSKKLTIPKDIQHLVDEFLSYKDGKLDITEPAHADGYYYLKAIREQKRGACRHRALAFKAAMEELHPDIAVRIITNDCHAFVEINIDGQWIDCNLGGYPAGLDVDDNNKPKEKEVIPATIPQQPASRSIPAYVPARKPEERDLETWNKASSTVVSIFTYCQKITSSEPDNKRLIELSSNEDVHAMQYLVQDYCIHTRKPIFYIDSPDDLVCSASWISRTETDDEIKGEVKAGPGGKLYQFLTDNPDNEHRILLVNYNNFTPADIVRFNTLIDKDRKIDGIDIPPSVTLIGLTNTKSPTYYTGADFHSRFTTKISPPTTQVITDAMAPHLIKPRALLATDTDVEHIELYHSANWENILLGHWVINGDTLVFEKGKLAKAIKSVVIHHGLWKDEKFKHFWEQAKLHGRVEHSGGTIIVPPDLQLILDDCYNWPAIKQNIRYDLTAFSDAAILNPSQFNQFFDHYQCNNATKTLHKIDGLIKACSKTADKQLHVYLSRELSDDQWAMIGDECNQYGVQLIVHPAPGVAFPAAMDMPFEKLSPTVTLWNKSIEFTGTVAIASTDVDATVAMLTREKDWDIIDVSACTTSDLLTHRKASFDKTALSFQFEEIKSALTIALENGKKIILKGHFSASLIDALAPLLASRGVDASGQLSIVSSDETLFNFMHVHTHTVSIEDKKRCLKEANFLDDEIASLSDELLLKEPLARLHARLIHLRIYPGETSDYAWSGLETLTDDINLEPLDKAADTKELTKAFNQERLNAIFTTLAHAPYVYLTGLTGVGKTTFVEKYIKPDARVNFFNGEGAIKDWAKASSEDKLHVLFIDEANLSHRSWSEFEGLFHTPPSILLDGVYYPLTKNHKVIFASNPLSYGDERKLAPIFNRHGNALVFQPLPLAVVYEDILKPIFTNTTLNEHALTICQPILAVYSFLCEHSNSEVLISPRELQMMALLVLSYHEQYPDADISSVAHYYAYHLAKNLVPEAHGPAFLALDSIIKGQQLVLTRQLELHDSQTFIMTDSRRQIAEQITDLLMLRELRQTKSKDYMPTQLTGGLGGMVLTGEPGIGKSEMLIELLRQYDYKEKHFTEKTPVKPIESDKDRKIFYRMPVGLPLSVKENLLLQAFDEGAIVIVDELNSSPMLERWFNDLLMGKHPKTKLPALNPGFCLICTQNPPNMAGRRAASAAFTHRTIQATVPPYTDKELCEILMNEGLTAKKATRLVNKYQENRHYALHNKFKPEPTLRELLDAAMVVRKRMFNVLIEELDQTIAKLTNQEIKTEAQALKNIIVHLKDKGEKKLKPYITLTTALLSAKPEKRPALLVEFKAKAMEAKGAPSPLWKKLATAMIILGSLIALTTGILLCTTGVGTIPGFILASGSAALLASGLGLFAANQQNGMSKAMSKLHQEIQEQSRLRSQS